MHNQLFLASADNRGGVIWPLAGIDNRQADKLYWSKKTQQTFSSKIQEDYKHVFSTITIEYQYTWYSQQLIQLSAQIYPTSNDQWQVNVTSVPILHPVPWFVPREVRLQCYHTMTVNLKQQAHS